jgi:CheY-like chemotaxis protein
MPPERDRADSGGPGWLRGKRILLAEDNITNQMVATQMLDALGARVDVANDGAEALEMLDARRYDVYLIDIEMPRVSGLDVIRAIRRAPPPLCDAPVIAVTAYALREHREKIAEAGADGLIPKPLIGIEQFGRDIMAFAAQALRRAAEAEPAPEGAVGLVSLDVYNGLADAIGPAAMTDLLGKIDTDLAKAEAEVSRGVSEHDAALLANATHVLISVCGAVGAERVKVLAQRLNAVANGRSDEDVGALGAEMAAQLSALRSFVRTRAEAGGV